MAFPDDSRIAGFGPPARGVTERGIPAPRIGPHHFNAALGKPPCSLRAKADARWDLDRFDADVRESQARRLIVYEALRNGDYYPWDYQPLKRASEQYMRNHMDLNDLEESKRFPRGE